MRPASRIAGARSAPPASSSAAFRPLRKARTASARAAALRAAGAGRTAGASGVSFASLQAASAGRIMVETPGNAMAAT